ncbi:MAG: hypothetical protein JSW04_01295 [Desulfobacterales bacterium]|nr:MAG: hypothetical protein JSW04_01295 [Desulfobacterales bacterium]
MITQRKQLTSVARLFMTLLFLCGWVGCTLDQSKPSAPLCSESTVAGLQPGLAVRYFKGYFRHVMEMPHGIAAQGSGWQGSPILQLNHRFGKGEVFDSGASRGIGMEMTGFIHFSSPGRYMFKAKSNDGIRITINDKVIVSDEGVHADRYSQPGTVDVKKSCWYPMLISYFQRKGTAMLELYWKTPDVNTFSIVPEGAYAHKKNL